MNTVTTIIIHKSKRNYSFCLRGYWFRSENVWNTGLHSLRSRDTTAAAAAGVNDSILGKYGYVMETLSEKLSVSKNLGYNISPY